MAATHRLFVYGNFLPGEPDHEMLAEAEHLGGAIATSGYKLVERGTFAALVIGGLDKVYGELYEVPTALLGQLDLKRDHPRLYERKQVTLEAGGEAWVYTLSTEQARGLRRVRHGDWRNRFKSERPEAGPFVEWAKSRYRR